MDFLKLVRDRYSCKKFDERAVEKDALDTILEAGRLAPTAKNLQEQHIYVVQKADMLAGIDSVTPCRYGAGTVLAVAYDKNNVFSYPGDRLQSGMEDASIVATHMMLAAKSVGVDSCWVNFYNPDEIKKVLGLPDNEEVIMMLDLGYAAGGVAPLPTHSQRKPITETVTYL